MKILTSNHNDLAAILNLYQIATAYMETKNQVSWPVFPTSLIECEIAERRQFKMVKDGEVACVWAITYNDEEIWGRESNEPSVYIHRIATSPDFRGQNLVGKLVSWADEFAADKQLKYIRLDTVGENQGLINHYQKLGFDFLGMKKLESTKGLPDHYTKGDVCLFQREVKSQ